MSDEIPHQDSYLHGVDVAKMIESEYGSSPLVVRPQIAQATIYLDDDVWEGDRFKIPFDKIQGRRVRVIGPDKSWDMKFLVQP